MLTNSEAFIFLAGKIETFSIECFRSKHLISDRVRYNSELFSFVVSCAIVLEVIVAV